MYIYIYSVYIIFAVFYDVNDSRECSSIFLIYVLLMTKPLVDFHSSTEYFPIFSLYYEQIE